MHKTFQDALNSAGFEVGRDQQQEVFDAFRSGNHVILKAPTGWGKTFAVNAAVGEGHYIYSLPLRVLVNSLSEATNSFNLYKTVAHHGQERNHPFLDPGDNPREPVKLVYTTLDQTLSAFLGIPIGVSLRQGNILPAVIDASHLIFDEFHLFDPEKSWTTAMFALQRSRQNCIILTATLSDYMLSFLEQFLSEKSAVGKVKVIEATRPFINAKKLIKGNGFKDISSLEVGKRTIIIKNDIASAKETAKKLRESARITVDVHLLHSELLSKDRKRIEEEVVSIFGEDHTGKEAILVATQVVEAGIDISCDVMHTDLCPPASFIQRAGRNARYEGEQGLIVWHPIDNPGPYRSQKTLIEELKAYLENKRVLTEEIERDVINLTTEFDKEQVKKFEQRSPREVDRIRSSGDYSAYKDMVRHIDNKNVAIGTSLGDSYTFISVSRSKFYSKEGFFNKAINEMPVKFGVFNSELGEVISTNNLERADFVLLDPDFVGYDNTMGFTFEELGGAEYFIDESDDFYTKYEYEYETYEEHVNRLNEMLPLVEWVVDQLVDYELVDTESNARFIIRLLFWAHDLGKLNLEWQKAHGVTEDDIPLAHSEKEGKYRRVKRPPKHAWIGSWAMLPYLKDLFGTQNKKAEELTKAIFWALADHHGNSDNMNKEDFEPYSIGFFNYLDEMAKRNDWIYKKWNSSILRSAQVRNTDIPKVYLTFKNVYEKNLSDNWDLYFLLSYILRKADQNATALVSKKKREKDKKNDNSNIFV